MKNGTPLWREAHFQVKMYKTPQGGTDFASSDVKKWYAAVARNPFSSQNAHQTVGTIFEVPVFKNGTPLWREAYFQLKMHKTPMAFGRSDPEKLHAAVARSTFVSQNAQNTTLSGHSNLFL